MLDRDSGFIQVLSKRLERIGFEHRVLASPVPLDTLASMRLSALIVDLAVLGPQAWEWLERVCGALPGPRASWSAPAPPPSHSASAAYASAPTTGSASPATPRRSSRASKGSCGGARTPPGARPKEPMSAGEVEIRADRFQAFVRGRSLELTRREFELVELLAGAEGRVLEREEIYSRLWGYVMVRGDRSVDVFVRKLRQKLKHASPGWRYIHTHFGIGYRFAAEPVAKRTRTAPHAARRRTARSGRGGASLAGRA